MGQIADLLRAALARGDTARYELRTIDPDAAWTFQGECCRLLGEAIPQVDALEGQPPPVDPPTPEPTPAPIAAVIGTYSGHGLAEDAYAGRTPEQVSWGPHHGIPLIAPADGRIELYTFGTPLNLVAAYGPEYAARHQALFDGWTCLAPEQRIAWPGDTVATLFGAQTMYVAVWWPAAPFTVEGQRVGHLHYGHVASDVRIGPIQKGERFGTSWDSGIRWEPRINARAAHTHCCAGAGTTLSPNGDLPGRLAAVAQGWSVTDIGTIPGPNDYETGQWVAGRRRSDFTAAGHPLPPIPS